MRHTRQKRLVVLLAAVLITVCTAPGSALAQADLEPGSDGTTPPGEGATIGQPLQNYITWNICQSACDFNNGSIRSATLFADRVGLSTTLPRAAAAQEICRSGYDFLVTKIGLGSSYGYSARFYQAKTTTACPNGVGNAIFWRNGCSWTPDCSSVTAFTSQHIDDVQEVRGYTCGASAARGAWYCSGHITSKYGATRVIQSNQLAQYRQVSVNIQNGYGLAMVMMGDFNVEPHTTGVNMNAWFATHLESDSFPQPLPTHKALPNNNNSQLNRKFDYVFAGGCAYTTPYNFSRFKAGDYSDHLMVRGYFAC